MIRKARPFLAIAATLTLVCIWWLLQASKTAPEVGQAPAGIPVNETGSGPVAAHRNPHPPAAPSAIDEHELRTLHQALQKKPDHTPVLIRLAVLAAAKGRSVEATEYLKEALRHDPESAEARLELGRVLFNSGDLEGAIEETQKILKKQPKNPDALYNLGAIYGNLGNREMAEKYWRALVAASPESESGKLARTSLSQLTGNSTAWSF